MKIPFTCFYALVQAAGIKTVRIKAGRLRAPATDCFLEVREFAVWKKNLFWDFVTKSSPAWYQAVIPVCDPFLTVPIGSVVSAVHVILPPDLASCRKVRAILNRSRHDRNSMFQSCLIFLT